MAPLLRLLPRALYADPHTVTPSGVTQWLEAQPQDQPVLLVENLVQRVKIARKDNTNLRRQLKQLEQLLAHADPVLRRMEKSLDQCHLPLDSATRTTALNADRLLKNFIEAYIALSRKLGLKWFKLMYRQAHMLAVLRATQLCYRRAMVAHRAHASGSTRRWAQLQALFMVARQQGFARHPADAASSDTVERVYVQTALVALLDPASLGGADLARVRFYVERFGQHAQVIDLVPAVGDRAEGVFVLSDSSRGPRRLKADHQLLDREAILDVRPLIAKTAKLLAGLRKGTEPARLSLPLEARDPAYGYMLARCVEQWTESRARKDPRNKTRQMAALVSGFDSVRHFLATAAFKRSRSDSLDGIGEGLAGASQWEVVDHSASGFGLRFASGHAAPLGQGELVAVHPSASQSVFLCATRRVRTNADGTVELGLEILSDQGSPASMSKPMGRGIVNVPVLLMPKLTRLEGAPGLIAPIGDVRPGMALDVPHKGKITRLEAIEAVERLATCELIHLRKLSLSEAA
ncbi:MAG: hypothetical protein QM639_15650 [Rhodocyclaceae bacterium]